MAETVNQYEVSFPPETDPRWAHRSRVQLTIDRRSGVIGPIFDRNVTNPKHPYSGTKVLNLPIEQARSLVREGWVLDPVPPPEPLPEPKKETGFHTIPLTLEGAKAQEAAEKKSEKAEADAAKVAAKEAQKARKAEE